MNTRTSERVKQTVFPARLTLLFAAIIGLSACNSTNNNSGASSDRGTSFPPADYIRANNGMDNVGTIDFIDQDGATMSSFNSGANEGVVVDAAGHLYQAADITDSSLRVACNIGQRMENGAFNNQKDREINGANTGLLNPKGIAIAHQAGLLLVANFNASQITVFGTTAAGDVAPFAETALAVSPWDLDYDQANDRLFVALTDGTIAVYDDYVATGLSAVAANRTITPADSEGNKISVNMLF